MLHAANGVISHREIELRGETLSSLGETVMNDEKGRLNNWRLWRDIYVKPGFLSVGYEI